MSAAEVYHEIKRVLGQGLDRQMVDESSLERLTLLVLGIIQAGSASPARIAAALHQLGFSAATMASIERRIRRIENDPELSAATCVHPFARWRLALGKPRELLLLLDPTSQDERVVMVTAAVWYRGRALPLAWAVWPANAPLVGPPFWARIAALLAVVADLLPAGTLVTWVADRAFGSPAFTDLIAARGWQWLVRVQGQTRYQDQLGNEGQINRLLTRAGQRRKLRGRVFKKRGWREASVVAFWGVDHRTPLLLVSSLPPCWSLVHLYRRRFPIEALFRDYKSSGWQWERGQVADLEHVERLLVGMALATWLALCAGAEVAAELLAKPPTGQRRTLPPEGKRSLFTLGLHRLRAWIAGSCLRPPLWLLRDWLAPNWRQQLCGHHARAFVFTSHSHSFANP